MYFEKFDIFKFVDELMETNCYDEDEREPFLELKEKIKQAINKAYEEGYEDGSNE